MSTHVRTKLLTEMALSMGYLEAWHIQLHSSFPHNPSIHKQLSRGMWIVLAGNSLQKAAHSRQPLVHHQPHTNSQTFSKEGRMDRDQHRGFNWLSFSRKANTSVPNHVLYSLRSSSSHRLMCKRLHLLSNYLTERRKIWNKWNAVSWTIYQNPPLAHPTLTGKVWKLSSEQKWHYCSGLREARMQGAEHLMKRAMTCPLPLQSMTAAWTKTTHIWVL